MSKLTVSMFWQGPLSLYEKACMLSFLKQGFEIDLFSYQELDVPDGVKLKDAQTILDQSLSTKFTQEGKKGCLTAFSDLFRYQLLSTYGGIWVDTDVFCLRPSFDFAGLKAISGGHVMFAREDETKIATGVIMSEKNDPLLDKMLEFTKNHDPVFKVWGTLGPLLATDFAARFPEQIKILPIKSFYPIHYNDFFMVMLPGQYQACLDKTQESYGLHLWNSIIKKCFIPQNMLPPEGSFLYHHFKEFFPNDYPCLPENTLIQLLEGTQAMNKLKKIKTMFRD